MLKMLIPKEYYLLFIVRILLEHAMNTFKKIIKNHTLVYFTGNIKILIVIISFQLFKQFIKEYREMFNPNDFDYIIIDEVHRAGADSYQELVNYFTPNFLLGMSATLSDLIILIYIKCLIITLLMKFIYNRQWNINLLCPFHYYGISDYIVDGETIDDKTNFNDLV